MRPTRMSVRIGCGLLALAGIAASGCERGPGQRPAGDAGAGRAERPLLGPESSPVPPELSEGWCGGHGVPESVCTRCNDTLIARFQAAGDWCGAHGLPESQCTICNPEVEARWAELDPSKQPVTDAASAATSRSGAGGCGEQGWCWGHDVPEAVCTRCNPTLIARFKAEGDWCGGHGLPESQCILCNPEVEQHWAALRPKSPEAEEPDVEGEFRLERHPRLLTGRNDPVCQVDTLRIRFVDGSIARKAGIETAPVAPRPMSATVEAPAEVEFDATRVTRVTPRLPGIVRDARVHVGATVAAGEVLAVLESPLLGEAKSRYIERREDYLLAEADYQRMQTVYDGTRQMLAACDATATMDDIRAKLAEVMVGQAKSKLLRAHAALQLARANCARQTQLREKRISSDQAYETARSALAAADADFAALREEISFNNQRDRLAAERGLQVARSALRAAERRLHILGLGDGDIEVIGTEEDHSLSRYELRSPSAGRVIERSIANGEAVRETDVLFVVADTSSMWLLIDLSERDVPLVREGLPVLFTLDGLRGRSFQGQLTWISAQADDRTRTVRARADLPNPGGSLRAKMFGSARIVVHENTDVLSVPEQAVQTDGCCQLVFVQQDDSLFVPRKVTLGADAGGYVEIVGGVADGETVVTSGSFLMKTEILKASIGAGCCEVDPGR